METVGLGFCFEDMPLRRRYRTVGRTVTEPDIVGFINTTGMTEVLFTNLDYLQNHTDFPARLVPGAQVFAVAEGLVMTASIQETGVAFLGMDLNIEGPVFANDTLHVEVEVIEARRTSKRPDRALVRTRNTVKKQDGKTVMVYTPLRMMKCRTTG